MQNESSVYTIPSYIIEYIKEQGYPFPYSVMQGYVEKWGELYKAKGSFWDYTETDNYGNRFEVHRKTVKPAKRVCREWASLLLDECTQISTESSDCNDWLKDFYERIGFFAHCQELIERSFAQGTGGMSVWVDPRKGEMQVRRYFTPMTIPLSWDDDGVSEVAFATNVSFNGKRYDQLQMHVLEEDCYHIKTVYFTSDGKKVEFDDTEEDFPTGSQDPWFAIVRPAIANTCVDLSPYGMSIYEDAIDVMYSVDACYNAFIEEVDLGKLRVFINDMLIQHVEDENGNKRPIPFGKSDATIFRAVDSGGDDLVKEFAPALRIDAQIKAYRGALQTMGDSCGFGLKYFDIDDSGGIRTATEVSSDNSALMRNIRKHENLLRKALQQITKAVLQCARSELGIPLPDEGNIDVMFDDSIITDTAAEKAQDMAEVGVTMNAWEYRMKWYGEDEKTAKANVPGANNPNPFLDDNEEEDGPVEEAEDEAGEEEDAE